jgi:EmrB/QacA subfamily drug resistance transporter
MPVTTEPPALDTALYDDPDVHRRRWLLLGVMCLALVLVVMAVSSLNVATPSIQQDLSATSTQLHWIIDAYAIVFAGLLLPAGALGDRYGRKGALLLGLGLFAIGLLVTGLGGAATQVIVGRGIMGAGSALVMPATLSMIAAVFPPDERTKAIAVWTGIAGAGAAIGPVMSGALLEEFWWGSTVLVNLPVVALAAGAIAALSPRSRDTHVTPLDPAGAVLSLVGMVALLYGIIEGAERGWTDGLVVASFAAALVLLGAFVAWERRAEHPMLPIALFADRRFSVGSAVVTATFFCMFGFFFLSTLYMQYVLGYSALATGLATLPMAAALVVAAPRSVALAERLGAGAVVAGGFALIAVGLATFTRVGTDTPYVVLAAAFVLMGAGLGMAAAPATGSIMSAVPLDKAGVGSAVNDTTRELGGALGIAVLGTIVGSAYRSTVDLSGTGLPADDLKAAEESIGGAWGVARQLPEQGAAVLGPAQDAFVDAFRLTNAISLAVAVAAAALVLATFRRSGRGSAAGGADELVPTLPAGLEPAEALAG